MWWSSERMHTDTNVHHKINSYTLEAYTEVPRHTRKSEWCVCACVHMCMYICTYVRMFMRVWLHPKRESTTKTRPYVCSMNTHSPRVHTSVL